jgi:signal peptidase I
MIVDFSLILVVATLITGVIWGLDSLLWRPGRQRALASGAAPEGVREPVVVEYARSFFPVIFVVLLIRSFLFEPFRIPSDSMMPTLLDGDFIFVSKFAYGLKLPVINTKVVPIGTPHRGDVIVFRKPSDPSTNYIKRLVGLPGDHIEVRGRQVFVNDQPVPVKMNGPYPGPRNIGPQADAQQGEETLGKVTHRILYINEREPREYDQVVPAGHYFFMGDNRDNSRDSRYPDVGFVPEKNLVGKAVRIWLNWDLPEPPLWGRIGDAIR